MIHKMASLRDFSIKYLHVLGKVFPTQWLIKATNQKYILPFYHAVSDQPLPHIDHLYRSKNVKEFINDLEFILQHFTPVDYKQFTEIAASKQRPQKPVCLLSFDDGLREFHDVISPLLINKGIPAVCFVNSAFIDNKSLFFKYKASLLISLLRENKKSFDQSALNRWVAENQIRDIESWLLLVDYAHQKKLDEFASRIGYDFRSYLDSVQPYLTAQQIEKLISDGFHFGAHSVDHPEYRFIPFQDQIKQTTDSIQFIKDQFDLNYSLFAFPFTDYGVSDKFFQTIFGDKIVELSFGGAGLKKERYTSHFQRIAFERGTLRAKEIYKIEMIYSAMQSMLGKGVIRRT